MVLCKFLKRKSFFLYSYFSSFKEADFNLRGTSEEVAERRKLNIVIAKGSRGLGRVFQSKQSLLCHQHKQPNYSAKIKALFSSIFQRYFKFCSCIFFFFFFLLFCCFNLVLPPVDWTDGEVVWLTLTQK